MVSWCPGLSTKSITVPIPEPLNAVLSEQTGCGSPGLSLLMQCAPLSEGGGLEYRPRSKKTRAELEDDKSMDYFASPKFNLQTKFVTNSVLTSTGHKTPIPSQAQASAAHHKSLSLPSKARSLSKQRCSLYRPLECYNYTSVFHKQTGSSFLVSQASTCIETQNPPDPKPHCSLLCDRTQHSRVSDVAFFHNDLKSSHTREGLLRLFAIW